MSEPEQVEVEKLNIEALKALAARGADGPLRMLNLLAFKPDGGRERYLEYAAAAQPFIDKVGGSLLTAFQPDATLIGDHDWDIVALVHYPTRQAFLDMVADPGYQAITHLRTDALTRGELIPMEEIDGFG